MVLSRRSLGGALRIVRDIVQKGDEFEIYAVFENDQCVMSEAVCMRSSTYHTERDRERVLFSASTLLPRYEFGTREWIAIRLCSTQLETNCPETVYPMIEFAWVDHEDDVVQNVCLQV